MRGSEQAVDDLFPGVGRLVFCKSFHGERSWRQAGEIEVSATDQRGAIGLGLHFPATSGELGGDKGIDGGGSGSDGSGNRRLDGSFERPPVAILLRDAVGVFLRQVRFSFGRLGREAALFDIGADGLFFRLGELAALRHLTTFDEFPQQAAFRFARRDDGTTGTAVHHSGERREIETGHLLLRAVAGGAAFFKDGKNLTLEQRRALSERGDRTRGSYQRYGQT